MKKIKRDEFDQPVGDWSETDLALLAILEEVASPDTEGGRPERSLMAYVADIRELLGA